MDDQELRSLASVVEALYPGKVKFDAAVLSAWKWILEEVDAGHAMEGLKAFSQAGGAFPPTAGEVYQHALAAERRAGRIAWEKKFGADAAALPRPATPQPAISREEAKKQLQKIYKMIGDKK